MTGSSIVVEAAYNVVRLRAQPQTKCQPMWLDSLCGEQAASREALVTVEMLLSNYAKQWCV